MAGGNISRFMMIAALATGLLAGAGPVCVTPAANAQSLPASQCKDHPLLSRFAGATLFQCRSVDYEEIMLPVGPIKTYKDPRVTVGGKLTSLAYSLPKTTTATEIIVNYRQALLANGFTLIAECAENSKCVALRAGLDKRGLPVHADRERGLVAKRENAGGAAYVVVTVGQISYDNSKTGVDLDVMEVAPVKTGQVTIAADAINAGLARDGKIALYGIYFDSGSAQVKPESKAQLDEIAKLFTANPKLDVFIVGHTDSQGTLAANQDLARRRADAVVGSLVSTYKIAAARLTAAGVGPLAPVSTNATESGRALNRRTELVVR